MVLPGRSIHAVVVKSLYCWEYALVCHTSLARTVCLGAFHFQTNWTALPRLPHVIGTTGLPRVTPRWWCNVFHHQSTWCIVACPSLHAMGEYPYHWSCRQDKTQTHCLWLSSCSYRRGSESSWLHHDRVFLHSYLGWYDHFAWPYWSSTWRCCLQPHVVVQ